MIYAQIKNEEILNKILIDDESKASLFAQNFDHCVRIDHLPVVPDIGWYYKNGSFTKVIDSPIDGGIPEEVPHGTADNFTPFKLSADSYEFEVSLKGDYLTVGCHIYDYRWIRYALWAGNKGTKEIGPFSKTSYGILCKNRFKIMQADVDIIYSALCTLRE